MENRMERRIEMTRKSNGRYTVHVYVRTGDGGWTGKQVSGDDPETGEMSHTSARLVEKRWFESFVRDEMAYNFVFADARLFDF